MLDTIHMENQHFKISIVPNQGACISQVFHKPSGTNLLKPLDKQTDEWPNGGIPILFPFAGRVWNRNQVGEYTVNSQAFLMNIHGFLYQRTLKISTCEKEHITLIYQSTDEDFNIYPFAFDLEVNYILIDNKIKTELVVKNRSKSPMPISPGFHPYFIFNYQEHQLQMPSKHSLSVTQEGRHGSPIIFDSIHSENLHNPQLQNIIIKNHEGSCSLTDKIKKITLHSDKHFHYFVFWGKPDKTFICLEPWFGLPNAIDNKKGLKHINPSEKFSCYYDITISHPNHSS